MNTYTLSGMTFARTRRGLLQWLWGHGIYNINPIKEGRYYTAVSHEKFIATHCPRIDSLPCEEWARRYGGKNP